IFGEKKTSIPAIEQEVLGCSHAEVGAYLLGLWGLPDSIVEAVAWHHTPSHVTLTSFAPIIAVHVADHFDHQIQSYPTLVEKPALDEKLLATLGLQDRVPVWLGVCKELDENSK